MPTSTQLESAWQVLMVSLGETEWINGVQLATGVFVRYLPASSTMYRWNTAGAGSWTQITNLSTFLSAGTITPVDMTSTV